MLYYKYFFFVLTKVVAFCGGSDQDLKELLSGQGLEAEVRYVEAGSLSAEAAEALGKLAGKEDVAAALPVVFVNGMLLGKYG